MFGVTIDAEIAKVENWFSAPTGSAATGAATPPTSSQAVDNSQEFQWPWDTSPASTSSDTTVAAHPSLPNMSASNIMIYIAVGLAAFIIYKKVIKHHV